MAESDGRASGYLMDLINFLRSTFQVFTHLPVSSTPSYSYAVSSWICDHSSPVSSCNVCYCMCGVNQFCIYRCLDGHTWAEVLGANTFSSLCPLLTFHCLILGVNQCISAQEFRVWCYRCYYTNIRHPFPKPIKSLSIPAHYQHRQLPAHPFTENDTACLRFSSAALSS